MSKEERRLYMREYRARNPEKHRIINNMQSRKWRVANPEKYRAMGRRNARDWAARNPEKRRAIHKATLARNPHTVLANRVRDRINRVLKGTRKSSSTFVLVGCTPAELKVWLEQQFKPGMSWVERGKWHIDHKKPCASFDLKDPEQQKQCFHYTNLQPLWAAENLAKGSKQFTV